MDVHARGPADQHEHLDVERGSHRVPDWAGLRADNGAYLPSDRGQVALRERTVFLVTRNLPPLRGGMERLNAHLAMELVEEGRVVIIGPRGCGTLANDQTVVYEAPGTSIPLFLA